MNDSLVARVAALKTSPTPDLKQMWREMFLTEPPPFNRRFLETRLAYRIQELALGGLRRETIKRLEKLMLEHARNLEFEQAARVRDQLTGLRAQAFGGPGRDNVIPLRPQ